MRKFILSIVLLLMVTAIHSQRKIYEIGLFAGAGYYMGDVNQTKLFYSPKPVFGILYKIDFNSRYAIRFSGNFAQLAGNDADSDNGYQKQRAHSFGINIQEFSSILEFNFLPYKPKSKFEFFSPYVLIGIGVLNMPKEPDKFPLNPVIPFGMGFKFAPTKRIGIAVEWTYRKTFTDYIDQLQQPDYTEAAIQRNKQISYESSNDWYSFAGITLTYKFAFGSNKCAAYSN